MDRYEPSPQEWVKLWELRAPGNPPHGFLRHLKWYQKLARDLVLFLLGLILGGMLLHWI
jgi:hypothetical protein